MQELSESDVCGYAEEEGASETLGVYAGSCDCLHEGCCACVRRRYCDCVYVFDMWVSSSGLACVWYSILFVEGVCASGAVADVCV